MANNRDEFSKWTKELAAKRVGYRCSFPNCGASTIGASMEGPTKTSLTGQAAHICAAAPGGKRYDATMTSDERSSLDNCIWLCDYHARLIDTDATTYTVEKLHQWKKDAEAQSSLALADKGFFATYSHGDGNNYYAISRIFEDLIALGNYQQLQVILSQYQAPQSDILDELVTRYNVIYDVYCHHDALNKDLAHYLKLPCKNGVSMIIEHLFGMLLTNQLKEVVSYCADNQLKRLIDAAIAGTLDQIIIVPQGSEQSLSLSVESKVALSKAISTFVWQSNIWCQKDSMGNKYNFFEGEFFFQFTASIIRLKQAAIYNGVNVSQIISNSDYCFISQNIKKISSLDLSLKEQLWADVLFLLLDSPHEFEKLYQLCPEDIKHLDKVKSTSYTFVINHNPSAVCIKDLIAFSDRTEDYGVLLQYLKKAEPSIAANIFDEHAYLFKKNSAFLRIWLETLGDVSPADSLAFLSRYKDIYSEDFLYHCLLAMISPDSAQKAESIAWLKAHSHTRVVNFLSFDLFIGAMAANKEWDYLVTLSEFNLPHPLLNLLSDSLSQAEEVCYLSKSKEQYEKLLHANYERQWVRYNLGMVNNKLGFYEESKRLFQEEYDLYHQVESLLGLICSRYNTNEYKDDRYLSALAEHTDCKSQSIVAATHLRLKKFSEARKFFLRALLLDDTMTECFADLYHASSNLPNIPVNDIRENTVCTLQGKNSTHRIAIHSPDILMGIHANHLSGCEHFSIEDPLISNLLFHKIGDTVHYNGNEATVISIRHSKEFFQIFAFQKMIKGPGVHILQAATGDDFIREITPILKSSSESISSTIANYNSFTLLPPLTVFSKMTGKDMLSNCLFLAYGNSEKIRNNLSAPILPNEPTFILNYDSIVFLSCMGFASKLPPEMHISCSKQVKNQLLSDIAAQMQHIENPQEAGQLAYVNHTVTLREKTADCRRSDYAFLSELKDFLNRIDADKAGYDYFPNSTMNSEVREALISLLSAQNMMVEGGTLALAQKTNNSVLVTDDQFLYALASEENQINIGLISFLSVAYKDWETLLDISKRLQRLNFSNYFPLNLYDRIVSSLCEDKANISEGSQKIQKWILSDTDDTPTLHHEDVILRLAKEVYNSGADYLDPGGFLTDCVFQIIKRRSPETAKQLIGDTINALHTYLICEDPPSVSASDCASNSNQPCNSLSSAENTLAT